QIAPHRTMANGSGAACGRCSDTEHRQGHGYEQDDGAPPPANARSSTQSSTGATPAWRFAFAVTPAVLPLSRGTLARRVLKYRPTAPGGGSAWLSRKPIIALSRFGPLARPAAATGSGDRSSTARTSTPCSPLQCALALPAPAAST